MNRYNYILLVILTTSLMGSSFTVGKIGLTYVSPLLPVGLRFMIAGLIMAMLVIKKPHPKLPSDWGKILLMDFSRLLE